MYNPKETMPMRKKLTDQQRAKRTKAGISLALLVILLGAAWGIIDARNEPDGATNAEQTLRHDLHTLWIWSDEQLIGGSKAADWTIRWNVTGKTGLMTELIQKLFTDEKGRALDKLVQNEGRTVTGTVPEYGGRISLSLASEEDGGEQLMLLLETGESMELDRSVLLDAAASISGELVQSGAAFSSSLKAQGYSESDSDQPIRQIMKLANAKPIDRYEDGGTISETFYTGMLRSSIDAGSGKTANLQIALHKETHSDRTAISIGVPVITGDYSTGSAGGEGK
ncbi:YwmB family TATA-box binding protein [Paenibacillus harenae]|uniref:YwmB family TATA-box binding protein n=1 Tax=Paenibacillus harenae TaxID=306543 RepID=UPI0003FA3F40|nr:YwmB family TATA-box binding protein [Paenibacillus harenae]